MDGYVFVGSDMVGLWWVIGESVVGYFFVGCVGVGEVVWIFIGVWMFDGVDVVIF